jgi:transcriptional regulator with XRE-family HTH domain
MELRFIVKSALFVFFENCLYVPLSTPELYNGVGGEQPVEKLDLSYMGSIFKEARLAGNMTQLAEQVGKTARYIQAIENEERSVSIDTLIRLVRALGISADTVAYPDREMDNGETEQLIRCIRLLTIRDRKVLLASAKQMLETE